MSGTPAAPEYDGLSETALAARLGVPRVAAFDVTRSTLDVAHDLAARGASAGTLVIAGAQSAGRGRSGHHWTSERGAGVWLTIIEHPDEPAALEVLSLRVGLALAPVLEPLAGDRVRLKWPNDIYAGRGKLAGILVEARWRDGRPEWTAIGVGINVRAPAEERQAAGLRPGVTRLDVLDAAVPALRRAAARRGGLAADEVEAFAARDTAAGRVCLEPVKGVVRGIDARGALLVDTGLDMVAVRAGSLRFPEEQS